ncbi:hypothetical protein E2C01_093907 [Portunus trituberculatus]|uniref:Uncharacterized protein n=1 Tax=Portunus trituberculatus TaxID=210409 RepID=A0A5B7K1P4_PORTR|nr:hypothetical protein [Portunus trituberculatus]
MGRERGKKDGKGSNKGEWEGIERGKEIGKGSNKGEWEGSQERYHDTWQQIPGDETGFRILEYGIKSFSAVMVSITCCDCQ